MQAVQKVGLALVVFVTIPFLLLTYWGDVQSLWGGGAPAAASLLWPEDVERVKLSVEESNPGFRYDWPLACRYWERAGWDYNRLGQVVREAGNNKEVFYALGGVLPQLWEKTEGGRAVKATDGSEDDRALVREFCDAAS